MNKISDEILSEAKTFDHKYAYDTSIFGKEIVDHALDCLRDNRLNDLVSLEIPLRNLVHKKRIDKGISTQEIDHISYMFGILDALAIISGRTLDGDFVKSPEGMEIAQKIMKHLNKRDVFWVSTSQLSTKLDVDMKKVSYVLMVLRQLGKVYSHSNCGNMMNCSAWKTSIESRNLINDGMGI